MKYKIAIPNNPIFNDIFSNYENSQFKEQIELFRVGEEQLSELALAHRVDIAFINPIVYGKGVRKVDFRILPINCFLSEGYTKLINLKFKKGLTTIENCLTKEKSFFADITKILMLERYEMLLKFVTPKDNSNYDAELLEFVEDNDREVLDISEDWLDHFKYPLVLGFWVAFNEEEPENILEIVNSLRNPNLNDEMPITSKSNTFKYEGREGKILHKWNEEVEASLHLLVELLFQYELIPEMAAVKLLGRD